MLQEPEELFETVTQCLMSGADRDALSGWGAIVYVMCAQLGSELQLLNSHRQVR